MEIVQLLYWLVIFQCVALKETLAELILENRLLKKMFGSLYLNILGPMDRMSSCFLNRLVEGRRISVFKSREFIMMRSSKRCLLSRLSILLFATTCVFLAACSGELDPTSNLVHPKDKPALDYQIAAIKIMVEENPSLADDLREAESDDVITKREVLKISRKANKLKRGK